MIKGLGLIHVNIYFLSVLYWLLHDFMSYEGASAVQ